MAELFCDANSDSELELEISLKGFGGLCIEVRDFSELIGELIS